MTDVDLLEHKAGPAAVEAPFRKNCVRCGNYWPCPTKSAELRADADERLADRQKHNPQRMLDVSEVVPGCWVNWRGSEATEYGTESRGGVVISIDHVVDPGTGESMRAFNVAKEYRGGVSWDRLTQDQLGSIDPPNPSTVKSLRRAMGRVMGARKGAVMTDERRIAEAIPVLLKAVA